MRLSDATCDYRHESYGSSGAYSATLVRDFSPIGSWCHRCCFRVVRLLIEIPGCHRQRIRRIRVRVYILHTCIIYIEKSGTHRHSIGARSLVGVTSRRPLLALLAGTGFGFVKMAEKSGSPAAATAATAEEQQPQQFLSNFIAEIIKSPVNLALVGLIAILVYKIVKSRTKTEEPVQEVKKLPKLRRDFAIEELTKYDGKGPDGRILVAVNGSVYDVTRGSKFYGPGEFEATYRRSIFFFSFLFADLSRWRSGHQARAYVNHFEGFSVSPSL